MYIYIYIYINTYRHLSYLDINVLARHFQKAFLQHMKNPVGTNPYVVVASQIHNLNFSRWRGRILNFGIR